MSKFSTKSDILSMQMKNIRKSSANSKRIRNQNTPLHVGLDDTFKQFEDLEMQIKVLREKLKVGLGKENSRSFSR